MLENLVLLGFSFHDQWTFRQRFGPAKKIVHVEGESAWASLLKHYEADSSLLLLRLAGDGPQDYPGPLSAVWSLKVRGKAPSWVAWIESPELFPEEICRRMGAAAVFTEPFEHEEAFAVLKAALNGEGPPLPRSAVLGLYDLIHIAWQLEASAVFSVSSGDRSGKIKLRKGRLVEASVANHEAEGREALATMLAWDDVQVSTGRLRRADSDRPGLDLAELLPAASIGSAAEDETHSEESPHAHTQREKTMGTLDRVCQTTVEDVGDALACGVVDLNTGIPMGIYHNVPYFTQAYIDAVAAAAVDMFRGKNVRRVENLLSRQRGKTVKDSFSEIFINSSEVFHFMKVIKEKQSVVVLVTRKTTNQGMGWAALRNAVNSLKDSLP